MLEFILERKKTSEEFTLGTLSFIRRVDDEYLAGEEKEFICDTLEPPMKKMGRNPHVHHRHKGALTAGRYPVVITPSEKFGRCLPLVVGVPKMMSKDVRMLIGNTVEDIEVGFIPGAYRGFGKMVDSRNMIYFLKRLIVEAKARGEGVWLKVKR